MTAAGIRGHCDARFAAVREAFTENFVSRGDVGASVAVYLDGKAVVDLWGGYADADRSQPWERDTIVNVMSTTKGMAAICALRLVEAGLLDLDAPVATYWPEFAKAGKDRVLVRHVLNHRAGLPAVRRPLSVEHWWDWEGMVREMEAQATWWPPGTRHGYHTYTFGWLVGELVRRVAGESLGSYFRRAVAGPLGVDFHVGLESADLPRVADALRPPPLPRGARSTIAEGLADPESMQAKSLNNPPWKVSLVNRQEWRRAEIPSANGHGNARALARVYGGLAQGGTLDGVTVLSPEAIQRAASVESEGMDAILGTPTRYGLGFQLNGAKGSYGPNTGAFGHGGMGGSLGFADPQAGLGFGYAMNQYLLPSSAGDPRQRALIEALYAAL